MLYYVIKTEASGRYGPWVVKRTSDGEVISYHQTYETARNARDRLNDEHAVLRPLTITPNPKRHITDPIADRLNPRPWRPDSE